MDIVSWTSLCFSSPEHIMLRVSFHYCPITTLRGNRYFFNCISSLQHTCELSLPPYGKVSLSAVHVCTTLLAQLQQTFQEIPFLITKLFKIIVNSSKFTLHCQLVYFEEKVELDRHCCCCHAKTLMQAITQEVLKVSTPNLLIMTRCSYRTSDITL